MLALSLDLSSEELKSLNKSFLVCTCTQHRPDDVRMSVLQVIIIVTSGKYRYIARQPL